jgi:glycogen synthase
LFGFPLSSGVKFPNGDVQALTQNLFNLLQNSEQLTKYKANSHVHLLRHHKSAVAKAYLEVIKAAI